MTTSPRLGYAELVSGQATPETTVNEIARYVEQGANTFAFKSRTTTAEPAVPADGDCYLVPTSATGTHWSGKDGKIAFYENTAWVFLTAKQGFVATVADESNAAIQYGGSSWAALSVTAAAPNVQAVTSAATVTPTFSNDMVKITAQAAALTLANWSGTSIPAWGMAIRIKDNGTARAITYGTQYRAIGVTLPTTTVVSKTLYLGCIWNADDSKIDVVAVAQEA
jgi:hypothetical protein